MLAADQLYLMTGLPKSVANSPILVEPATMFAHFHPPLQKKMSQHMDFLSNECIGHFLLYHGLLQARCKLFDHIQHQNPS